MNEKRQRTERVPLCGDAPGIYMRQIYALLEKEQKTIYTLTVRRSPYSNLLETTHKSPGLGYSSIINCCSVEIIPIVSEKMKE